MSPLRELWLILGPVVCTVGAVLQYLRGHTRPLWAVSAGEGMASGPDGHIQLTFKGYREDDQWVSECVELGTSSCGDTVDEAFAALEDATLLYLQTLDDAGERARVLRERGIEVSPGAPEGDGEEIPVRARPNEVVSPHPLAIPAGRA
jgi:predicted RNase H-like HicB family nuclease